MQRISGEIERTWRVLVMQEGASKREIWKHKVEQVIEETDSLKLAIDRVHKRVRVPSNFRLLYAPDPRRSMDWTPC